MTDHSHSDEEFFRQRGFGIPLGFGHKPAIVVVDLTRAFTDPARPLGSDLAQQIDATNQLLDVAHEKNVFVVVSTVRYDDPQMRDAGIWAIKQKGTASLLASGDGHEIDPRVHTAATDSMLYKKYASCFFGTDLLTRLVSAGVDTVILTGTSTSGCVRATAVDACQHGFRPMVVREAVGDRSQAAHDQSLFDLNAKYADVVTLAQTLEYLRSLPVVAD